MARPIETGNRRYKPIVGVPTSGTGLFRTNPRPPKLPKKPVTKKPKTAVKTQAPVIPGLFGPDAFGISDPAEIERLAREAAASTVAGKRRAIDQAIVDEQSRAKNQAELMKEVYAAFAQFITGEAGQVQGIYQQAGKDSAAFSQGMQDAMNVTTGGINAGINADLSAIGAPAGQQAHGDAGAAQHIADQGANMGNLLAAQGANWAAYVAVQPGIYSRMAVYQIGKMLQDSTYTIAKYEAQKLGLADDEASAYGQYLAQLQKDQFDRQTAYLKYQQGERNWLEGQRRWEADYRLKIAAENNKNARFQAQLDAVLGKPAKPKKVSASVSKQTGVLTYEDGTPVLRNGKPVPVAKTNEKPPPGSGKIDYRVSQTLGRWTDAYGNPIPGMEGVAPPPKTPGKKPGTKGGKTPIQNREGDWSKLSQAMVRQARMLKTGNKQTGQSPFSREQARQQLWESYGWWVNKYSAPGAGRKQLKARLDAKIKRVLDAVGFGTTTKSGNTFTGR